LRDWALCEFVSYLTSLKAGSEGHGFRAYPDSEISRWD